MEEIQKTLAGFTDIPAEIDTIRSNQIKIIFDGIVPDEETIKKIETALSQFGEVKPLHCREYDIVSWIILR